MTGSIWICSECGRDFGGSLGTYIKKDKKLYCFGCYQKEGKGKWKGKKQKSRSKE